MDIVTRAILFNYKKKCNYIINGCLYSLYQLLLLIRNILLDLTYGYCVALILAKNVMVHCERGWEWVDAYVLLYPYLHHYATNAAITAVLHYWLPSPINLQAIIPFRDVINAKSTWQANYIWFGLTNYEHY